MMQQYALAFVRGQENDPRLFQGPSDLIACCFVDLEPVFGFKTLERGQRYSGLVGERLLCPSKQRASCPRLSSGDHA